MNTYFRRYANPNRLFDTAPVPDLRLIVVIPCHNEADILPTLESLNNSVGAPKTEILIIVNESIEDQAEIKKQNKITLTLIDQWQRQSALAFPVLTYHLIAQKKEAGVGLARKVGMDEAARRFEEIGNPRGVICCFDADSTCQSNYLATIADEFYNKNQEAVGASIYFEHPLPNDSKLRTGIVQYELHLRYFVNSLRAARYPFAHHTVGSSMAVRSDIYQKIGGMNKRKAGEDFYFLHKLMPAGTFIEINSTTIYPSPRVSNRVPFGTGKAMQKWLADKAGEYLTYDIESFRDLRTVFELGSKGWQLEQKSVLKEINKLNPLVSNYLKRVDMATKIHQMSLESRTIEVFEKKFFHYWNGLRVLKFLHEVRDEQRPNKPVLGQAGLLAQQLWAHTGKDYLKMSAEELLLEYRKRDRATKSS